MMLLLLLLVALSSATPVHERQCGYESCTESEPGVLNVHIVAHTHDDVGWLKTVDQYYYGSRNSIQKAGVQYILDSVIKELWEDPKRRFIYVETAFFWKWWTRQGDDVQQKVHTLVRQGRLQFVGGAWSMNDEAAAHYQSIIDQFSWGLRKLNETFGKCGIPRVGWQIDPFGHSREFASLLAGMGYDGLFLGRIDYQDKMNRRRTKSMEMLWRGDDDLGQSSDIFTGINYNTYSPPPGFCFDVLCNDEPIIDDPSSPMFNVDKKVDAFLTKAREMSSVYTTNNILVTMGDDFHYQDANMWFSNLDKLIMYANMKSAKDGLNIKLFYSTPDCYLKAVKDAKPILPTKQDDFFPYSSDPTAFWTGYFTSRPTTKYFERQANNYLQMMKHLQVLADLDGHNRFVMNALRSAVGMMQHHDAVTGTEKEHVAHDYERILNSAIDDANNVVAKQAFNKFLQGDALKPPIFDYQRCRLNESSCDVSEQSEQFVVTVYNPLGFMVKEPLRIPVLEGSYKVVAPNGQEIDSQLVKIPDSVINIPTRKPGATHEIVFIAYLHPLNVKSFFIQKIKKDKRQTKDIDTKNYNVKDYLKDIKDKSDLEVLDRNYKDIAKDGTFDKVIGRDYDNGNRGSVEKDAIKDNVSGGSFVKDKSDDRIIGKMGYPALTLDEMRMLSDEPKIVEQYHDVYIENEHIKLRINNSTGEITHVIQKNITTDLKIQHYYWTGCTGDNSNTSQRSSGAYIFRPKTTIPIPITFINEETIKGNVVQELRATTNKNAASSIRLYTGLPFIEHDFVIGPISIEDNEGKEYVVRYETDVINNGIFYTDSNGRQVLKRKLNERPQWNLTLEEPIAGNYYPVTNEIYIENDEKRIAVLTDRSQGGSSLVEGTIELMVHRRLLHDDAFGVGEALNETANGKGLVMRGRHRIIIEDTEDDLLRKKNILQLHLQPVVFVSKADKIDLNYWLTLNNCYKGLKKLPDGLHLLTLEPWTGDTILIRFENYGSKDPITVDVSNVFNNIKIKSIKETTLAANQWLEDHEKWKWNTKEEFSDSFNLNYDNYGPVTKAKDKVDVNDDGLQIKIKYKQIRTFEADYEIVNL